MDDRMRHHFDRIDDAVRREFNLVRHGRISEDDMVRTLLGEIRLIAAEDLVVRREAVVLNDDDLHQWIGGDAA
jgi:hypothetical protein